MAGKHSTIPRGDADFDKFFKNINQYVAQQCGGSSPRWTHIPQAARTALVDVYTAWYTAYAVTFKPCTPPERAEKTRQHKLAEKALRDFINIYLRYHPDVTAEDKENMGLHIPDGTRTPVNPPEEGPDYGLVQLGPRMLGINYWYGPGRKGSKPRGVEGARIYYGVLDAPPAEQAALPASVWATRCPHAITFRETDRGRRAYFALKWEVRRGGKSGESGWSEILSEIIP
ncbi:MAG: hypothetical protein LBH35_11165 [Treponema sp.]|jgi:hypothetical protein|nr:hypothetical protein [Treponema sp.]